MTMFPERFTVVHEPYDASAEDSQGNPKPGWGAPVERKVVTIYPYGSDTDSLIRDEQSGEVWHLNVLTLDRWGGLHDRVTVDGEVYDVVGAPDDFTKHPWGFHGCYRLKLRAVMG